ncbi:MAG: helix-turn-helix domain-containing protein [Syntrophomonadaceae bacterium]|nr:helix-turn-helix domain-containing protein [Syntrophomonadaceae bacterium]
MRVRLKARRNLLGYTQKKMSELTGIERTKYTRIENGSIKRVSVDDAFLIAKALNTTIESIFALEGVCQKYADRSTGTRWS